MSEGRSDVSPFDRAFFSADGRVSRIGSGSLGGKASGLLLARDAAAERLLPGSIPGASVVVPSLAVVATGVFDAFVRGTTSRRWLSRASRTTPSPGRSSTETSPRRSSAISAPSSRR